MITVDEEFHKLANGSVRPLDWNVLMDFNDSGTYVDYSTRAVAISVSRSFEFPYNVQSAIADISLDNHDNYFSFTGTTISPIAEYILPNRPLKIKYGFTGAGTVSSFTGHTESMPEYDGDHDSIVKFTALDDLSTICSSNLPNGVGMLDARTDQVIEAILTDLGVPSSRYVLEQGANTIPFVLFSSGKNAGNALKELVQAENGRLWQDEEGIIRFTARQTNTFAKLPVMLFSKENTISISPSRDSNIINSVSISAEIRQVEDWQQVFLATNDTGYESSDDNYRIPANGTKTVWLAFEDPVVQAMSPMLNVGSALSGYTVVDLTGQAVNSGITISSQYLFGDTYKLEFSNTNSFAVSIKSIWIIGKPAKMVGGQPIEYSAYDETSIAKFGTKSIEITENKCFGSVANIRQYANDIITKRSDYNKQITMKVKGDPSLQLGDLVTVSIDQFQGIYEIIKIENVIDNVSESRLETEITLQFAISSSATPFTLNQSVLDGTALLG